MGFFLYLRQLFVSFWLLIMRHTVNVSVYFSLLKPFLQFFPVGIPFEVQKSETFFLNQQNKQP
ncbi:hypothetical protein C7N43_04205 [Sphingobacteriales bacterium UPWRP_1]|nr:hypothetical protein B6N25_04750 [Sphingobacteriales bacterium TSM_CSS]PSJ78270.1 hypothetical protein C7N43_04205 [Sphingobacteriales bacterium UPWRP_1]